MNAVHELRVVLWLAPRTGSRACAHALRGTSLQVPFTHQVGIPEGCARYRVVATCRNPFARAVSAWQWTQGWARDCPERAAALEGFGPYLRRCTLAPQTQGWDRAPELIRFEHLAQDLVELLPGARSVILPSGPTTTRWARWYGPEERARVVNMWGEDFARLPYQEGT